MENCSSRVKASESTVPSHFQETYGEILPDGTIVEVVAEGDDLLLCHFDGNRSVVLPYLNTGNIVLRPPKLAPSLCRVLRFPTAPMSFGSLRTLFSDISAVFEKRGIGKNEAQGCSLFVFASWIPEAFPSPPTLLVCGQDMVQASALFGLFSSLCRRSLPIAELNRHLPFAIRPTLLSFSAEMSRRELAFWEAANFRCVGVPRWGGALESLACPRALFTNGNDALSMWGSGYMRFRLFACQRIESATDQELVKLSAEFQPKLLRFRLRTLQRINEAPAQKVPSQKILGCQFASKLLVYLEEDPAVLGAIGPFLLAQEREILEQRGRDPYRAIIECLWSPAHQSQEISVTDLTSRVTALLRSRGEVIELNSLVVGWKLTHLGLPRGRNNQGMLVRFSRDVRLALHRLARNFQLELRRFVDCPDCKGT